MMSAKLTSSPSSNFADYCLAYDKHTFLFLILFFFEGGLCSAHNLNIVDTCTVNDFCENAIDIPNVYSDGPFACIDGCNRDATPEIFNNFCEADGLSTVWYKVYTDPLATLMNFSVYSNEIESPVITLYAAQSDCDSIAQVPQNYLDCLIGSNGAAEFIGLPVIPDAFYYIAVSSFPHTAGVFSLCVNTISSGSNCALDHEIVVMARSDGWDLEGPYNPGETISICMNVNSYTTSFNGCQWFQGLIPVFGNGWDPSSFDADHQPLNTTINGKPMGEFANGVYGVATWDWFTDVDYHHDDPFRHIGDFDGNGVVEICSALYEADCLNTGGLMGGCCSPCWGSPIGTLLPPGWFAYGINGSCPTPGPPIRVDWGDGGSCSGNMGPWRFCFDLKTRKYPHCLEDETTSDLTLGFYTFSDGETGGYNTGTFSICALDRPARLNLSMSCPTETDLGVERVEDRCAAGTLSYIIDEPGIRNWTWEIYPPWAVLNSANEGDNGFLIVDELFSPVSSPVEVIYYFTGYEEGSSNIVFKKVRFKIIPDIKSDLPDVFYACEKDTVPMVISATPVSGGLAPFRYLWMPNGDSTSYLTIHPPFQNNFFSVHIQDSIGCMYEKEMILKVQPCHLALDTIVSEDESNETQTHDDGPMGNGNFASTAVDTCTANDLCATASLITGVSTDSTFICIQGCTINATPDPDIHPCLDDFASAVWYKITTDSFARLMNIQVTSLDSLLPVFVIFKAQDECNMLTPITLTQSNIACAYGPNGIAEAFGTDVEPNTDYFIVVAGMFESAGSFEMCVNMIEAGSTCVKRRNIEITSRSSGGSLSGPFYPGETIGVCMNVDSFSAEDNGCQWFQGLVPVFGNGWDPSSFDGMGQPKNATINGIPFGVDSNGIYLAATWDWFSDVDYHRDYPYRQLGDYDNNGTLDLCDNLFDPDCQGSVGLMGGCCPPCWGTPLGDILPPGWFAYGINGSCPAAGPPIRLDWGDGNTCGGGMGPWKFCFDLKIRDHLDCSQSQSMRDLNLTFFTFADGETGTWTGTPSVCAQDQPAMLNLPFVCSNQIDLGIEVLEDRCSGSTLTYTIEEPGVQSWIWTASPPWAVITEVTEGDNGYTLQDILFNPTSAPVEVTYFFTGFIEGSLQSVIKQVRFQVMPEVQSSLPEHYYGCELDTVSLIVSAEPIINGLPPYQFAWSPGGETTPSIVLLPPYESGVMTVAITDSVGCVYYESLHLHITPCHLDIMPPDTSNEMHELDDLPIRANLPGALQGRFGSMPAMGDDLKVYPIPATDFIHIEWSKDIDHAMAVMVYDARGYKMDHEDLSITEREEHRMQLNVRDYAGGVYLVILQTEKSILASRIVKF